MSIQRNMQTFLDQATELQGVNRFPLSTRLTNSTVIKQKMNELIDTFSQKDQAKKADDFYVTYIQPDDKPKALTIQEVAQAIQNTVSNTLDVKAMVNVSISCPIMNYQRMEIEAFESLFDKGSQRFQSIKNKISATDPYNDLVEKIRNQKKIFLPIPKSLISMIKQCGDRSQNQKALEIIIQQFNIQLQDIHGLMRSQDKMMYEFKSQISPTDEYIFKSGFADETSIKLFIYPLVQSEEDRKIYRDELVKGSSGKVYIENGGIKKVSGQSANEQITFNPSEIHEKLFLKLWPMTKTMNPFIALKQNYPTQMERSEYQPAKYFSKEFQQYYEVLMIVLVIEQMNFWYDKIKLLVLHEQSQSDKDRNQQLSKNTLCLPNKLMDQICELFILQAKGLQLKQNTLVQASQFKHDQLDGSDNNNKSDSKWIEKNMIYYSFGKDQLDLAFLHAEQEKNIYFVLEMVDFELPLTDDMTPIKQQFFFDKNVTISAKPKNNSLVTLFRQITDDQQNIKENLKFAFITYVYSKIMSTKKLEQGMVFLI